MTLSNKIIAQALAEATPEMLVGALGAKGAVNVLAFTIEINRLHAAQLGSNLNKMIITEVAQKLGHMLIASGITHIWEVKSEDALMNRAFIAATPVLNRRITLAEPDDKIPDTGEIVLHELSKAQGVNMSQPPANKIIT